MKKLLFALLVIAVATTPVLAADVTVMWDAVSGSTSYDLEQSTNTGTSWALNKNVLASACTGTPARCTATIVLPATGLVLVRIGAINSIGKTIRYDSGIWYCGSCSPPATTANVGVQ